jgi:hypothetical protein
MARPSLEPLWTLAKSFSDDEAVEIGMNKTGWGISLLWQLIILELVLSVIFVVLGHFLGNAYFRGVGVGLIISWVTSVIAYFVTERRKKNAV